MGNLVKVEEVRGLFVSCIYTGALPLRPLSLWGPGVVSLADPRVLTYGISLLR